jgi:hypothetical protein
VNSSSYRAQELALSADNNILYVTSRYRVQRKDSEDDDDEEKDEEGEDDEDERFGTSSNDDNRVNQKIEDNEDEDLRRTLSKRQFSFNPFNLFGGSSTANPASTASAPPTVVQPGFMTAILLTKQDSVVGARPPPLSSGRDVGAGYPIQIILQVSTSTSGGRSNSVTPAQWGNEFVALADSEKGLVQVWRFDGLADLPRGLPPGPADTFTPRPPVPPKDTFTPRPPVSPVDTWSPRPPVPPKATASQPQRLPQSQSQAPQWPSQSQSPQWQPTPQPDTQQWAPISNPRPSSTLVTTTASRPPPWQNPSGNLYGGSRGVKRSLERRQNAFANVRANIVAEWKAPDSAVGVGDPAAPRGSNRESDDRTGRKPQWGRGCCANAVWYD